MSWQEFKSGDENAVKTDERGREINPHVPMFIAKVPWYMDGIDRSVHHQKLRPGTSATSGASIDEWYQRGQPESVEEEDQQQHRPVKKFRKGSCENCGAMSHKTRDCVERPRKLGAKWTGKDIRPDERLQSELRMSFEGKRDRWNGYDPATHAQVIEEWEQVEAMKKELREKELEQQLKRKVPAATDAKVDGAVVDNDKEPANNDEDELAALTDSDNEGEAQEEDKYAEGADVVGQKVDMKSRTTVRNLRIREDTAKYLRDLNAADYDPKGRSERVDTAAGTGTASNNNNNIPAEYATSEQFAKYTGQVKAVKEMEEFSWEAAERGLPFHLQADPTRAAIIHREYTQQKDAVQSTVRQNILAKYGGEKHLKAPPRELLVQSENYVEYTPTGQVIRGTERAAVKSRYEEDNCEKYAGGHTAVWGSFYNRLEHKWGYACCRSLFRKAYCTGMDGIEAELQNPANLESAQVKANQSTKSLKDMHMDTLIDAMKKRKAAEPE